MVLNEAGERVLLMRRHRFIVDRWGMGAAPGWVRALRSGRSWSLARSRRCLNPCAARRAPELVPGPL